MKSSAASLLLSFIFATLASAADFRLDDGSTLTGELVSLDDSTAVIRNATLGEVRLPRARLVDGLPGPSATEQASGIVRARRQDPAGYALFLLPTAFTPKAGTVNFRDFELFFLNLGFSPTDATVISGGALFPITTEFQLLTLGLKQRILEADGFAVAATGNVTIPVAEDAEGVLFNANLVASRRFASDGYDDALGLHALIGYWRGSEGDEDDFVIGAGFETRLGPRSKFIGEIYAPLEAFDAGVINLGFRLHGDRLSADIAGMRPLEAEGSFLFFPLLVINYSF